VKHAARRRAHAYERLRGDALGAWKAEWGAKLAEEALRRHPEPSRGRRGPFARLDPDQHALRDLLPPSQVAVWMMVQQLVVVLGEARAQGLVGLPCHFRASSSGRVSVPRYAARAIWYAWSLLFCPAQLSNTFHMDTFGAFIDPPSNLEVRRFEDARIRGGYFDAVFSAKIPSQVSPSTNEALGAMSGAIHYYVGDYDNLAKVEPLIPLVGATYRKK